MEFHKKKKKKKRPKNVFFFFFLAQETSQPMETRAVPVMTAFGKVAP